jgi:ribosomal protein L18
MYKTFKVNNAQNVPIKNVWNLKEKNTPASSKTAELINVHALQRYIKNQVISLSNNGPNITNNINQF